LFIIKKSKTSSNASILRVACSDGSSQLHHGWRGWGARFRVKKPFEKRETLVLRHLVLQFQLAVAPAAILSFLNVGLIRG
jgi:hypothetical protein